MQRILTRRFWLIFSIFLLFVIPNVLGANRLIDIDFKNADIKDLLRALADQEGVNLIIDTDVIGTVTIHLSKVTFNDALNIISKNNGLLITQENKVYHISKIDNSFLKVEYADGLLTLEAREAKLRLLIETISQKTGANLVPAPELQDRITISLTKTPLEDGILTILTQANCMVEKIGQVSFIRKKATERFAFTINYQNNLLNIDAQNVPLPAIARAITEKTGVSVIPDQGLSQNVSIYFQDLPLADALAVMCDTNGLILNKETQSFRISRKSGPYRIKAKDNLLTIEADNVDVTLLVNEISRQSGINIIISREVRGSITAHLQNTPLFQGLSSILETQGWIIEKQGKNYLIRPNNNQNQNIRISYDSTSKLFSLDVQSASLTAILDEMARKADLNMVVLAQVNWTINTVRLQQLSFNDILNFLLKGTIYTYKLVGDTYMVGDGLIVRPENADFSMVKVYPIKYLKADQVLNTLPPIFPRQNFVQLPEKNALIVSAPPAIHELLANYLTQIDIASIEDRTEVIKIKYLKAEDVLKLFPPAIPKTDLVVIKEANAIAVTGPQNLISLVKQYIDKVDQVNPMIVFDIMVVSINNSDDINWNPPSGKIAMGNNQQLYVNPGGGGVSLIDNSAPLPSPSPADKVIASINLLVSKGKAKVLSNPTISTLNGYQASFKVSTKKNFNITTETKIVDSTTSTQSQAVKTLDSGIYFTITPWVSANNQITMEIKPTISEFSDPAAGSNLDSTIERTTETTVRVSDGQTVVISGLKSSEKRNIEAKIPFLGDIPIFGYFFKTKTIKESQNEFVIVITPYLVYDDTSKLENNQRLSEKFGPEFQNAIDTNNSAEKTKKPTNAPVQPSPSPKPTPTPVPSPSPELKHKPEKPAA